MLHIYLDTALLAVPNYAYGSHQDDVQELIDRVTHFSIILSGELPIRIIIANDIESKLDVDYPTPDSIKEFLDAEGISHVYSVNDLFQQYLYLLDRAVRPAEIDSFEVFQASGFTSLPPLPQGLGPTRLLVETQRILTTVAANCGSEVSWLVGSSVNGAAQQSYNISALVEAASHDPSPRDGALSFSFCRPAMLVGNFSELVEFSVANELWRSAQTSEDIHLAISLGALAIRRTMYPDAMWSSLKPFSIGCEFVASLNSHACAGTQNFSDTTFEVCAKIVADVGAVVLSPMGRPRQRRRSGDNAGALRSQITTGNPALRLMLWETGTGLEMANVGLKKALHIETGAVSSAVVVDIGIIS